MKRDYLLGLGTFLIGAAVGASLFPREVANIEIFDTNEDGSIDYIVDHNWKIILRENMMAVPEVEVDNKYRTCLFSTKIPIENIGTQFSEKVRPLLEYCLKN